MATCMDTGSGAFTYKVQSTIVSVTCTDTPSPFQPDRTVTFTALDAQNNKLITAQVVYHDGLAGGVTPVPVDVAYWNYCAHDSSACA
jgi:hypothetical protein